MEMKVLCLVLLLLLTCNSTLAYPSLIRPVANQPIDVVPDQPSIVSNQPSIVSNQPSFIPNQPIPIQYISNGMFDPSLPVATILTRHISKNPITGEENETTRQIVIPGFVMDSGNYLYPANPMQ